MIVRMIPPHRPSGSTPSSPYPGSIRTRRSVTASRIRTPSFVLPPDPPRRDQVGRRRLDRPPPRSWKVATASSAPVFCRSSVASDSIESAEAGSTTRAKSLRCPVGAGHSRARHGAAARSQAARTPRPRRSPAPLDADPSTALRRAVVRELEVQPKVVPLHGLDDGLQVVRFFPVTRTWSSWICAWTRTPVP